MDLHKTIAEVAESLEPNLDEAVGLAVRAQSILGDETLAQAILDVKANIIKRWNHSNDPAERERLHCEFRAIDAVIGKLRGYFDKGQLAAAQRAKEAGH